MNVVSLRVPSWGRSFSLCIVLRYMTSFKPMALVPWYMLMTFRCIWHFPISDRETAVQRINKCITDIISWSIQNKLIINASKTEVLHFMSKFAPTPPHPLVVSVDGVDIAAATKVRNLGVIMNKHLSMSDHVTKDLPICNHIHKKNWTNSPIFGQEINRNPSSCTDHVPCW